MKMTETYAKNVTRNDFLVIHRAKMLDDICVVEPGSMLVSAPEGYTF